MSLHFLSSTSFVTVSPLILYFNFLFHELYLDIRKEIFDVKA